MLIPAAIWPSDSRENSWGTVFFVDERRDVGLNPPLGHSWAMWGRRVLLEGPSCSLEMLSGPRQQFTIQNIQDVPLAVQFRSWGNENEGRPSSGCDGRPNRNRGWILASSHSPACHGCIPTPNTGVLMVDALLNVKFLLVREHQVGQHAIFHEVPVPATTVIAWNYICSILKMKLCSHKFGGPWTFFFYFWRIE